MPQPPLRQSNAPSMVEINDPTSEIFAQKEPSHSRGGKYNLRPSPNPNYSEKYRYCCVQKFIQAPFHVLFSFSIFFPSFAHYHSIFFLWANPCKSELQRSNSTLTNNAY